MASTIKHDDYPVLTFPNERPFEKWMSGNSSGFPGIWLKIAKVNSGIRSINHAEALDVALCYGWIDGL